MMLLVSVVLNIALVTSFRMHQPLNRFKKISTELHIFPGIDFLKENLLPTIQKLQIPVALFGIGYGSALVSQSVAITEQIQPILKVFRNILPKDFIPNTTIFPGVKLPKEQYRGQYEDELIYITGSSSIKIAGFAFEAIINSDVKTINGENKYLPDGSSNFKAFDKLHSQYSELIIEKGRNSYLPKDYNYFGTYDGVGNLEAMVKYNPFFASALTAATENGFEIDPYGPQTQFTIYTETLDSNIPRIVAEFDKNLKVKSLKEYTGKTLTDRVEVIGTNDRDKAYKLLFTLLHHGQSIHATTHLFHQLLTSCLARATSPFEELYNWAKVYNINEAVKYREVESVLFNEGGLFNDKPSSSIVSAFKAGPYNVVIDNAAKLNKEWSELKSADEYVYKFLFKNIPKARLDASGICVEYRNQAALIGGFATELDYALSKIIGYEAANKVFSELTATTGPNGVGAVTNVKQFIELMSASGLLHGSTLSMSRLSLQAPMVAIMDPTVPKFNSKDINYYLLIKLTIVGALEGYSVFSSTIPYKGVPAGVIQVLKKYEGKSDALKSEFFNKIIEDEKYFKDFGFIQTDHGPEGIDGKQYTIATYI